MNARKIILTLTVIALPLLAGSQCAFFFSSGGGSDDEDEKEGLVVVVTTGQLTGDPVKGVYYKSGSIEGVTGSNGEFRYEQGKTISFSIGDIPLGREISGKAEVAPSDLLAGDSDDTTAIINMTRLLWSLDSEPGDGAITIPPEVRQAAVRSNGQVSSAIEFLDFADDPAFANAASQLVAVLTRDYPFTAVLVDAETARDRLAKSTKTIKK